jgi:hypothetical protein
VLVEYLCYCRSATEYQCGVRQCKDCKICDPQSLCALLNHPKHDCDIDALIRALGEAVDEDQLLLGDAVTPRCIICQGTTYSL